MYLKSFKVFFSIYVLLIFSSMNVYSQKNETENIITDSLREVNIIENKKNLENRSVSPLQQIDTKTFTKLNSFQVSDALKYLSGVTVKDYGGIGGLKTVSVRGFGANHTAVSYDGIKVSDMQTGQIDIGKFSIENVELISLNNGQSDNIFQSASLFASTSVLNIKTLPPKFENRRNFVAKTGIKFGSFGLFNPYFLFQKKIDKKHSFSFNGEWILANGNYSFRLDKKLEGNDNVKWRKNSDVKNLLMETTFYSKFSENENGYVKVSFLNAERGLPGSIVSYNPTSTYERLWEKNFFTQAHYFKKLNSKFDLQLNAKYSNDFTHYLNPSASNSDGKLENMYLQDEIYGSASVLYKSNPNLSFSASSDLSFNKLDANLIHFPYPTRLSSLSILAGKYVTNHLSVVASLLYTNIYDKVKSGIPFDNQQKISPYAGFSLKPFEKLDLRFRAFYKNIFRLPTFNDLYYTNFGNRTLKPEDANQFNIGTTYSLSDNWLKCLSVSADVYHNEVKNKIIAFPNNNLFIWTMLNYGKVEINGADVNLLCNVNLFDSISLTLNNSFTYQYAVDKTNPNSGTFKNQLPYIPRISGGSSAILDLNFMTLSYALLWSGKRYSWFQNLSMYRLEPYIDQNISISKSFKIKSAILETALHVMNLGNENYEIVKNFPMPGRSFRVNLSIKF